MTEAEWLGANEPGPMLRYLKDRARPADGRKLRLFACACVGRIETLVTDPLCREALRLAGRVAEGRSTQRDLGQARRAAQEADQSAFAAWQGNPRREQALRVTQAVLGTTLASPAAAAWESSRAVVMCSGTREEAWQSEMLRELFGNPWHPAAVSPDWLRWNEGAVLRLARTIHDERRFAEMPILGDALEEAGCADERILEHCRSELKHMRGCWVLDLVLGEE